MADTSEGLINTAAQAKPECDQRIYGSTVGIVIDNEDFLGLGRVQVRFPWLPGVHPWARICTSDRGAYFIPQVEDEVLVTFNQGDIREPYISGVIWNAKDRPPASGRTDPKTKRILCTRAGHEIEFDDAAQTLTITGSAQHKITIGPSTVEIMAKNNTANVTIDEAGNILLHADQDIVLDASKNIVIEGNSVEIKSKANMTINGGQLCDLKAGLVMINS